MRDFFHFFNFKFHMLIPAVVSCVVFLIPVTPSFKSICFSTSADNTSTNPGYYTILANALDGENDKYNVSPLTEFESKILIYSKKDINYIQSIFDLHLKQRLLVIEGIQVICTPFTSIVNSYKNRILSYIILFSVLSSLFFSITIFKKSNV